MEWAGSRYWWRERIQEIRREQVKEFQRATQRTAKARGEEWRGKVTYETCGERSNKGERRRGENR